MSAFVDTNVLVRHLVGDPPAMAARATEYLRQEDDLLVADLVIAESIYVLVSFYEVDRRDIANAMRSLLSLETVIVVDRSLLLRSLEVYEHDRLDYAEAYLVSCAETTGVARIASFDRAIDRVASVERIEP